MNKPTVAGCVLASGLVAACCFTACGAPAVQPRDVRVAVPTVDAAWLDFVSAEVVIGPGEDKMYCTEMTYQGDDTAFTQVDTLQGKFGHHVILVSTSAPKGDGQTYDCTEMREFLPLAIPTDSWPTGHGSSLTKGTPVVMQIHYVNTSAQPILVRDVIRLKKMPVADVTTWVAPFALNHEIFHVEPHQTGTVNFDCTIPSAAKLLLVGGHMHENGTAFKVEWGPSATALTKLYEVTEWQAEYRDSPPVNLYTTNQQDVPAGTVMRTTCSWKNDTNDALHYPHEMCATFGLLAGTKESYVCRKSQ